MKKKSNNTSPKYIILFLLIAFGLGVLVQSKFNLRQIIRNGFVSKDTMQRQKLKKIFNIHKIPAWSGVQIKKETEHPTYNEQLIEFFDQENNIRLSSYLLIPKSAKSQKLPAVLCIHGHHSTKENVAGITSSPYNINYGHTLVNNNYITLIPDIRYSQDIWRIEDPMGLNLLLYGKSLAEVRIKDLLRCITYLKHHDQVDHEQIGLIGWSMGGGLALYLSAIDERVKLSYISCYFGTYEKTILAMRQSTDNYIPGIKNFGELYDVAALIAPRPLLIEHGTPDREFPAEIAKMAFEHVKHAYSQRGVKDKTKFVIRKGGHRFYGDQLLPWFNQFFQNH